MKLAPMTKTRLRVASLPLLTGLALVACTDDTSKRGTTTPGEPPGAGAAGTSNAGGTGAPTGGSSTEGNPMPGGLAGGPPPTGVVACDESVIGGSALVGGAGVAASFIVANFHL